MIRFFVCWLLACAVVGMATIAIYLLINRIVFNTWKGPRYDKPTQKKSENPLNEALYDKIRIR